MSYERERYHVDTRELKAFHDVVVGFLVFYVPGALVTILYYYNDLVREVTVEHVINGLNQLLGAA